MPENFNVIYYPIKLFNHEPAKKALFNKTQIVINRTIYKLFFLVIC